jgi:hypothetical protein
MALALPIRLVRSLALAVAGSAAVGASLAVPLGAPEILARATTTPLLLLGVPLLMLPSLYVASGMAGVPLALRDDDAKGTAGTIAHRAGVALLCFAPAMLFLVVSIDMVAAQRLLQWAAVVLSAGAVVHVLRDELKTEGDPHIGLAVFLGWAGCVVAIQVGLRAASSI